MLGLNDYRVLVTGGQGFLGKHVVKEFLSRNCRSVSWPGHDLYDLRKPWDVRLMFAEYQPDIVVHLAASVGGIEANRDNPGKYFYDNILMGSLVMDMAREFKVKKYVQVGTSCSYPAIAPVPVKESDLWTGKPNEVTGAYGIAKLALITMAQAYREQYGLNAISLIPVNLYGPGDTFDPKRSHVIPALIRNCLYAKKTGTPLVVWGTGKATREFLYVKDAARALRLATEHYDRPEPVNLGTGVEIFIKDLAAIVANEVGFTGEIVFDSTKPDGQLRRCFDVSRAKEEFGFEASTPLEFGIRATVEHYLNEQGIIGYSQCTSS